MKPATPKSKPTRILLWLGGLLGTVAIVSIAIMGLRMARMGDVPSDLDYSTTRSSDKGLFKISYTASTGTVPINQMHQWTLHLETKDGQPVENAVISVDGDMPQHGHGLPTRPRVIKYLGNGDYLVDGMKFQMGGWWLMDFTVNANSETDAVHFNMMLK
jgi:hypothetical protein